MIQILYRGNKFLKLNLILLTYCNKKKLKKTGMTSTHMYNTKYKVHDSSISTIQNIPSWCMMCDQTHCPMVKSK